MPIIDASQQSLLHASAKDDYYLRILRAQVHSLVQQILGAKVLIQWKNELTVLSDMVYFLLTTVQGSQTLGEEYSAIVQVDSSKRKIPSKLQRMLLVLLQASPYVLEKSLRKVEKKIEASKGISKVGKKKLIVILHLLHNLIPVVQKIHLILFYIEGVYANISLRIARIKHVLIRPYNNAEHDGSTFRWIAIMGSVQILSKLLSLLAIARQDFKEASCMSINEPIISTDNKSLVARTKTKCLLCLDAIDVVSVTICGHIFCWKCIIDWCSVKPECPSCRQICPPSKIVCLHHYDIPS